MCKSCIYSISTGSEHQALIYSFSKRLTSVPICGRISTLNSSPCSRFSLGFFPMPTPAGVPVMITVPAGNVVPWDRKLINLGMLKMRSLYQVSKGCSRVTRFNTHSKEQSCSTLPFFKPRMCSLEGSGIAEGETRTGPAKMVSNEFQDN